ncbi:hypothetical protein NDU88_006674 [Pleurodeles waltl]|uniref:Uncharacterized protein n=1 Tax=Pleurodeles waltl TaxID=8319 RepID=A0AAV7PJH8_PLEWA|nr:hypothetical protein NDU88_006674 [Pleurodeles waltl]
MIYAAHSAASAPTTAQHLNRPHPRPLAARSLHEGKPCLPPQMCCCLIAHAAAQYHAVPRPQPLAVSPPHQGRPPSPSRAFRTPVTLADPVAATTLEPNTSTQSAPRGWRLMTPRPICNEDGRDVRGRRGGEAEARTKRGVAAGRLLVGLISCGKNKRY